MSLHLRQVCLVASELQEVIDDLVCILGIKPCFVDPSVQAYGLENCLLGIGSDFLEVVAPVQADTAAGRYLERRGGNGGYMVITQAKGRQDQQQVKQNALQNSVRIAHEADRGNWSICQLHPGDLQASFLDIEWDSQEDFSGYWEPAGGLDWHDFVKKDATIAMVGVELQSSDPEALARLWSSVMGIPIQRNQLGDPQLKVGHSHIRFGKDQDGRGPGLAGIDIVVDDLYYVLGQARLRGCYVSNAQVNICGTRFYLV